METGVILVGLTGGIGSGKSTVAARLSELGCHVVDADAVAREIVEVGQPALDDLVETFGDGILQGDGSLDRAALATLAFADDDARERLNDITHPRIAERIEERIASAASTRLDDGEPIVVLDHPLLIENDDTSRFDALVVVIADTDVRLHRLVESRGLEERDARARMRAQADDEARRAAATHIVENNAGIDELRARVDDVYTELRAASGA